jgi:uncharacterized repeat protein (TIGR03803 family)
MRKLRPGKSRTSAIRLSNISIGLLFLIGTLTVCFASSLQAQTFSVLYRFKGGQDGGNPQAGVIQDEGGNLFGTTFRDGKSCGVVFKLRTSGIEKPLHTFGQQGCEPWSVLVQDKWGNLFGTTKEGGSFGKGIVFKLGPKGRFTVLHSFGETSADGAYPVTGLIRDSWGNLYGTTEYGGNTKCSTGLGGCGTIFKVTPSGKETVLHRFSGRPPDGANPSTGLVEDSSGNFFGAIECNAGEPGCKPGVFKLSSDRKLTVIDFRDQVRGLVLDDSGNLYGTGSGGSQNCGANGCGVVFQLDTLNDQETILYSFQGTPDGEGPAAGVIRDSGGNLYGTTQLGGNGWGTIFKIDPANNETILYQFKGTKSGDAGPDGGFPASSLFEDSGGTLYGTTPVGGAGCNQDGCGLVFKVTP